MYSTEVLPDCESVLARLARGHDIHKTALLEKPLPNPLPTTNNRAAALAHIRQFGLNSMLVDVDAKDNGLLVLAEAWYPGWRAEMEGQTVSCVPVNGWMRGMPVPQGHHLVRVFFRQDYLLLGMLISAASAAIALILLMFPNPKSQIESKNKNKSLPNNAVKQGDMLSAETINPTL